MQTCVPRVIPILRGVRSHHAPNFLQKPGGGLRPNASMFDTGRPAREALSTRSPARISLADTCRSRACGTGRGYQRPDWEETSMRAPASLLVSAVVAFTISAATAAPAQKWVTSWAASVHGPYPVGNPSAQPQLGFAFPSPESGARDQTFRQIVMPDIWGAQARLRFSNAFGTK